MALQSTATVGSSSVQSPIDANRYFSFKLSQSVMCTQEFRESFNKVLPFETLVPTKMGAGKRFTESGVVHLVDRPMTLSGYSVQGVNVDIRPISLAQFDQSKKDSMNKVYFRGFPETATKADVMTTFGEFGQVQYVYFMCESKAAKQQTQKMGYVIFETRASVEHLLQSRAGLKFQKCKITVEEYKPNKKSAAKKNKPSCDATVQLDTSLEDSRLPEKSIQLSQGQSTTHQSPSSMADKGRTIRQVPAKLHTPVSQIPVPQISSKAAKAVVQKSSTTWLRNVSQVLSNTHPESSNIRFNLPRASATTCQIIGSPVPVSQSLGYRSRIPVAAIGMAWI